uniref:EF-hand domain-containing protein n=2 Tax=Anolis carolinensis TaxID=28377 RepID=G1KBP5_ANOCA
MVHAVSDPSVSSSRLSEPDPNHTLEERVVHWYFKQLDKNASGDIGKKEIKPFKRFLRKKSKPKKCVKKFVEYCDVNNDKSLTVLELMGCLGVTKEDNKADTKKRHTPKNNGESTPSNRQQTSKKQG